MNDGAAKGKPYPPRNGEYNYEHFDDFLRETGGVFVGWFDHLHASEPAPDSSLTRLDRYLGIRKGRTSGVPLAPFGTEQIEFHEVDRDFWYERLRRNGERSVQDWDAAQAWLSEIGRTSADEGA